MSDVMPPPMDLLHPNLLQVTTVDVTMAGPQPVLTQAYSMVHAIKRHKCPERACNKLYKRKGDLTRHTKEAHSATAKLRCPILECRANKEGKGFSRMHRLVEHLMTGCSVKEPQRVPCRGGIHPTLFNKTDATWVAYDFNKPGNGFSEIVFWTDGGATRNKIDGSHVSYRGRVPGRYVRLYYRMTCPVMNCRKMGLCDMRALEMFDPDLDLRSHLQIVHNYSLAELRAAEADAIAEERRISIVAHEAS